MASSPRNSLWGATSTAAALTDSELKAAPGDGKAIMVSKITLSNEGAANSWKLEEGTTTLIFPPAGLIYQGTNEVWTYDLKSCPIVLTENTALTVTSTAADHATVMVEGSVIRV